MTFGDYLKKLREDRNWTQPIAATKIGIEQSYLSKLETGKSIPSGEIFSKLTQAYDIDLDDMARSVSADDLARLKDVESITTCVRAQERKQVKTTRSWLVAGLLSVMAGAACLGFAIVPEATDREYHYRSQGVLQSGEALTAFDLVENNTTGTLDKAAISKLTARIDQKDQFHPAPRGESFVETAADGKRYYKLMGERDINQSPMRKWFIAPAGALLLGGLGCFFIARTWRQ